MKKLEQPMERLTSIFKWLYLIHIMLAGNSVVFATPVLKVTSLLVVALGLVVILWRFLHVKEYIKYPFIKLFILLLAAFAVTILVNWKYGYISNIKILMWMTFQFGALFLFDINRTIESVKKELNISLYIIIGYTTIINLISVVMLFTNYLHYRILDKQTTFLIGVAYWGRLYGVHADPNYGAILSTVAVISAIYLFIRSDIRWKKVLLVCTIVMQAMFLAFSASRTGFITMCVSIGLFLFIHNIQIGKKAYKAVIVVAIAIVIIVGGYKGLTLAYNGYVKSAAELNLTNNDKNEKDKDPVKIGRDGELSGDVSNRRFDLWKNSIEITKTSPIVGIGYGNIVSYAKAELPDSYLLTNGFAIFNAFHNMFMDLLASQGMVGVIIFLSIIIFSLRYILLNHKKVQEQDRMICGFLFSTCVAIVVSSMFVSEILYVNNETTVLFWLLWGFLMFFMVKADKDNS